MKRGWRVRIAISLALVAWSLAGASCARQDSAAERDAEIDRRIEQRLAARDEAAAQQRLARERAELAARERALEAREASFAMMIASVEATPESANPEPAPEIDSSLLASEPYPEPQTYSSYPDTSVAAYEEPYGYVASSAPFYSDPFYCPPTTTFYSVINQSAVIVNRRRDPHRQGISRSPRGNHVMPPAGMPAHQSRPPVISRPPAQSRPPMIVRQPRSPRPPAVVQRSTRSAGAPQVTVRRVASKPVLAQTR